MSASSATAPIVIRDDDVMSEVASTEWDLVSNVRDKLDNQEHEGTEALIEVQSITTDKETLNQQLRDLQHKLVVGPEAVPDDVADVEDVRMFAKPKSRV